MSLLAIAPATKTVALGSAAVDVSGLSFRKLTGLIIAYPDLAGLIVAGKVSIPALIEQAPDAALAMFSLGLVGRTRRQWWRKMLPLNGGDDDLVAAFDTAPAGQQIEILGAIFDLTSKGADRAIPFLKEMLAPPPAPVSEPAVGPPETSATSTPTSSSG